MIEVISRLRSFATTPDLEGADPRHTQLKADIRAILDDYHSQCLCLYGDFVYRDGTPNSEGRYYMEGCPVHYGPPVRVEAE